MIRYRKGRHYVSVVALAKRGEQLKAMQHGKKSMTTTYTMNSPKSGTVAFPLYIACRYQKGKAKTHGVAYLFFAVLGNCRSLVLQVAEEYRHRFGIEASYRIMNAAQESENVDDNTIPNQVLALHNRLVSGDAFTPH